MIVMVKTYIYIRYIVSLFALLNSENKVFISLNFYGLGDLRLQTILICSLSHLIVNIFSTLKMQQNIITTFR